MRLKTGVALSTVRREGKDISAVISTAISELGGLETNPFKRMKMPAPVTPRQDERDPLPAKVIEGVYSALSKEPALLAVWTLLDFTGARPSEVRQLTAGEVNLSDPVPHIVIKEGEGRSLKTSWSTRRVPLVGEAAKVAKALVKRCDKPSDPIFPHLCRGGRNGPAVKGTHSSGAEVHR